MMTFCHRPEHFEFRGRDFSLSYVQGGRDAEPALRLRHEVYYREHLGQSLPEGIDRDKYDRQCWHLLVRDNCSGRLVGTCRINAGGPCGYYSAEEFMIGAILETEGKKFELGRMCIDPDFRNGAVFHLLILGILNFAGMTGTRQIFGCCSIPGSLGKETIGCCVNRLKGNYALSGIPGIEPLVSAALPLLPGNIEQENRAWKYIQRNCHTPLPFYLLLGAKAAPMPFYDHLFRTYDFFVFLGMAELTAFGRKMMTSAILMSNASPSPVTAEGSKTTAFS